MLPMIRRLLPVLLAAALVGVAATAAFAANPGDVAFDARDTAGRSVEARPSVLRERRELARDLGAQGVIDIDPATGTPHVVMSLDGALTDPSEDSPATVALNYVREHAIAFGLTAADLDDLRLRSRSTSEGGLTVLRWTQASDGIPAFDSGLKVAVDRAGRVLSVSGSPVHALDVPSAEPGVTAPAALAGVRRALGGSDAAALRDGPDGTRRTSEFADGSRAALVVFATARADQLAWDVVTPIGTGLYHAVVDATSGRLLFRTDLTKSVTATVFENYPGAPHGGTAGSQPLDQWLTGASTLTGPNAHAFANLDGDEVADAGEEVIPGPYTFQPFAAGSFCIAQAPCSWDSAVDGSWQSNLEQNASQAFYFVNRFHDHLESSPIGFDQDHAGFEGNDRVEVRTDDGATTDPGNVAGNPRMPDSEHLNNASMSTLPDGQSPIMRMYLFSNGASVRYRDVNGGDSAAIVYHEYTHGLSNRLVTTAGGYGALDGAQSAAMGEAWSDWYAMDYLSRTGSEPDTVAIGEMDVGKYVDAVPHTIRYQPLDCPVGAPESVCPPADGGAGSGGFTYGDFGNVFGAPEVHADGEIWAQTLWDLRTRLVTQFNSEPAGSDAAEKLITDGMRASPPEPSFLDMRNAILSVAVDDTQRALIWEVFTNRGMGFFASALDGNDAQPVEDFSAPPADDGPKGSVTGRVYDEVSGLPRSGTAVGFGGHTTFAGPFATVSADSGAYTLSGVPRGTYPALFTSADGGYDSALVSGVAISDSAPRTQDLPVRRDWAALPGGSEVTDPANDNSFCGPAYAVDHTQSVGWSAENPNTADGVSMVVRLPQAITVTSFAVDPGATCGDGASATLKNYRLETSLTGDADSWTIAKDARTTGGFTGGQAGSMVPITPTAGADGVRYVRLTMYEPQNECTDCSGKDWIDISELAVYGAAPNALPSGELVVPPTATTAQPVTLSAQSVTDPDSAIIGYRWDFDGNGTIDKSTTGPTTSTAYMAPGTYAAIVSVDDFRGGSFTTSRVIAVSDPAPVPTFPARPSIRLGKQRTKNAATFTVKCDSMCRGTATLKASQSLATRLKLKRPTVAIKRLSLRAGTRTVKLPIARSVLKALRRERIRKARFALTVNLKDAEAQKRRLSARPRVPISRR